MSLSFVDELQAQVERLEKEILKAEATGKDSGGDRVALSHLKALIEHFRGQVKNSRDDVGDQESDTTDSRRFDGVLRLG